MTVYPALKHKLFLERVAPSTASTFNVYVALMSEESTADPVAADAFMAALSPGANELVCDGYERQPVAGIDRAWVSGEWQVAADTVNFGALAAEHDGHAVKSVAVYVQVGDGSDDSLNWLWHTWFVRDPGTGVITPQPLTGDDLVIAWPADGMWTRGPD